MNKGLNYASDELRNDRECVLNAVRPGSVKPLPSKDLNLHHLVHYASAELRNDREVVQNAVKQGSQPSKNSNVITGAFSKPLNSAPKP